MPTPQNGQQAHHPCLFWPLVFHLFAKTLFCVFVVKILNLLDSFYMALELSVLLLDEFISSSIFTLQSNPTVQPPSNFSSVFCPTRFASWSLFLTLSMHTLSGFI